MKLYHGSNTEVKNPVIKKTLRALDFGSGFYLTSDYFQAEKWAKTVTLRRREGIPSVNVYFFDEMKCQNLNILKFENADNEWLDFIVKNRKKNISNNNYDLIIGPIANDNILFVINDYIDGRYTKEQALSHLLPQKLSNQFAFLSDLSLSHLQFKEVIKL